MTQQEPKFTFELRPGESDEEAGNRLAQEAIAWGLREQSKPQAAPISRDSSLAMQHAALASSAVARELKTIRERDGDDAALGYASGMAIAACMFVAFDLEQPEIAKSTINHWASRLNVVRSAASEADIHESLATPQKQ